MKTANTYTVDQVQLVIDWLEDEQSRYDDFYEWWLEPETAEYLEVELGIIIDIESVDKYYRQSLWDKLLRKEKESFSVIDSNTIKVEILQTIHESCKCKDYPFMNIFVMQGDHEEITVLTKGISKVVADKLEVVIDCITYHPRALEHLQGILASSLGGCITIADESLLGVFTAYKDCMLEGTNEQ